MDIPSIPVVHPWALFLRLGGSDPDKQVSIMPSCSREQGGCDTRQGPGIEIHSGHPCLWLLEMALPFGHQPALAILFLVIEAHGMMMCGAHM